jgi:hypothetical protein
LLVQHKPKIISGKRLHTHSFVTYAAQSKKQQTKNKNKHTTPRQTKDLAAGTPQ